MVTCVQCCADVPRGGFSASQLKKGLAARCKQCVDGGIVGSAAAPEPEAGASGPDDAGGVVALSHAIGSTVLISGLVSRPELNGCQGVVTGSDTERYEVSVRNAKPLRLKPANLTACADEKAVDPGRLPPWPGLSCGQTVVMHPSSAGEPSYGSLHYCFQAAVPISAKMAKSSESRAECEARALGVLEEEGSDLSPEIKRKMMQMTLGMASRKITDLPPWVQFVHTLSYVPYHYETEQTTVRFVIQEDNRQDPTRARSPAIIIDVLHPALACPMHLETYETTWLAVKYEGVSQKAGTAHCEPLLPVRYMYAPDGAAASLITHASAECDVFRRAVEAKGVRVKDLQGPVDPARIIFADSATEVQTAVEWLRSNEKQLAQPYRSKFEESSPFHGDAGYRPSFLVPPVQPQAPPAHAMARCSFCRSTAPDGKKLMRCKGCSASYCSVHCQRSHWAEHKFVCGKTANELRTSAAADNGPSVVFSLMPPEDSVGKFSCTVSHLTGQTHVEGKGGMAGAKRIKAEAPRDVHGGFDFMVKVQPPLGDGRGPGGFCSRDYAKEAGMTTWGCMVYDERRSFTSYLPLDCPDIAPLLKLVREQGWRRGPGQPGIKGYFVAKREGANLRIFANELLPQPHW